MFSKYFLNEEATHELKKTVEMKNKLSRDHLIYKTGNNKKDKTYGFQKFQTIRSFGRAIHNNDLSQWWCTWTTNDIDIFKESTKLKEWVRKEEKSLTLKNEIMLLNGRQKVLDACESGIFLNRKQGKGLTSILDRVARVAKVSDHSNLKTLSPRQMLQILPIPLVQIKPGNTSESLLNEIRKIMYSLYWAKRITKKSIQQYNEFNKVIKTE